MYFQPGPSRLKQHRRAQKAPEIIAEPQLPYAEFLEYLAELDIPSLEANPNREDFFVVLNKVASQLKGRHELELASEELFTIVFHKFFLLLNNTQSCVRAIVLRIFRLLLVRERILQHYLQYRFDVVVLRALDMHLNGEPERVQALKMMARMFEMYRITGEPDRLHFRKSFLHAVLALFRIGLPKKAGESKDTDEELKKSSNLWLAALGFLLETSIYEPKLVIDSIGTDWMIRVLMEPNIEQRIIGQVCQVFIAWLDCPVLRNEGRLNFVLEKIFSPLIEIGFFYDAPQETDKEGRNVLYGRLINTLSNCSFVFLNILRSWTGLFCCATLDDDMHLAIASPIRLMKFLGTGSVVTPHLAKLRDLAIDICCQFMDVPYAETKFATWYEALEYYATMHYPDRYKCSINADFVLADYIPPFNDHVDLLGSFRAAACYVLVNAGLSQSLVRLIRTIPDEPAGIKATLLLSDLLTTGASVLPRDWRIRLMSMASVVRENPQRGMILVHRLNQLNELILTRSTRTTNISITDLFVQCDNEPEKLPHEKMSSKKKRGHALDEKAVRTLLDEYIPESVDFHGNINWQKVDLVLQGFESDEGWRALQAWKHNDRCHAFFAEIVAFFLPHRLQFLKPGMEHERFIVDCGCRLFRLLAPLCDELHYRELLDRFVQDCSDQLRKENLATGVFASKTIMMNPGAIYYFALIGAVSSTKTGCEVMTQMMLFQIFLDYMVPATPVEYVKLIVSCLDYTNPVGLPRLILETAMTATCEKARKWVTRFLGASPAFRTEAFSEFISRLLLKQLGDSSIKVVRHVVRILHSWLPQNPSAYKWLSLMSTSLSGHGDAGVLVRTHIYSSEEITKQSLNAAEDFVELWDAGFNERYVEIVEDEMRTALTPIKRTASGDFARPSAEQTSNWTLPVPIHLYGVLARHKTGQTILRKAEIVDGLLDRLKDAQKFTFDVECLHIKSALLGLAHIVGNVPRSDATPDFVPPEVVPIIARYVEECPVLSVKGTAFWAMNILGAGEYGALQLARIGWESNRHLRVLEEVRQGYVKFPAGSRTYLPCFEDRPHGLETLAEESETEENIAALEESLLNAATMIRLVTIEDEPESHFSNIYRRQTGMKPIKTMIHNAHLADDRYDIPTDREIQSADSYREVFENQKFLRNRQIEAMHSTWSYVSLPCEVYLMTEKIFDSTVPQKKLSIGSNRGGDEGFAYEHNYRLCFHCSRKKKPVPIHDNVRNEILQNVNLMEILSKSQERKLFEAYRNHKEVFTNPCLYSDVLEVLSERRYKLGTRSLLHQLFWKAFQVNL
ncbi:hypothetical protein QR680_011032 [Steinernema hermaphroditum]|uniref:Rapamycin-insensitive companion of mTOR domain-containing protein n=1 Tax=Steinernema hermaphroditum TaxID=289476 RepID=A0AA39IQW0_9BILA|nr:hypothetical protein QR680_011032 [Steinernema hermaphroditum]